MKEGDKVRVIGNRCGGCHPVGYVGVITEYSEANDDYRVGPGTSNWYREGDLELLEGLMTGEEVLKNLEKITQEGATIEELIICYAEQN